VRFRTDHQDGSGANFCRYHQVVCRIPKQTASEALSQAQAIFETKIATLEKLDLTSWKSLEL
jgi:hypothetical protein